MAWVTRGSWLGAVQTLFVLVVFLGCGPTDPDPGETDSGVRPVQDTGVGPAVRCGLGDDEDGDLISTMDEGTSDADGDGIPNHQDEDSDGDGFSDADEAGDSNCMTPPIDNDNDGIPDFLDRDANGDGVDDMMQAASDTDGDGIPDFRDDDVDGDGIPNRVEFGSGDTPVDSDGDGTPDILDIDSDGDTIPDAVETASDRDGDGTPNYLDLDTDGDGVLDATEAGDSDLETDPRVCANEINPYTGEVMSDGYADFADSDSDNDGLSDGEEADLGTDPCDQDSDDDGLSDLAEGAYERYNCPDGTTGDTCGCATSPGCTIPPEYFYVVLPYNGEPVERDLEFGTTIRVADVFFLTDITGSMGGTLSRVQDTVGSAGGLIERINATFTDGSADGGSAWFGGGIFQDFPFGGYGGSSDDAFRLTIGMTPASDRTMVATAWSAESASGGSDGPESHTEALFQTINGRGQTWTYSSGSTPHTVPDYQSMCLDTGWGAPCFREAALPIIVLFTDICAHEGPPGESSSCGSYTGISPTPADWTTMISELNTRGAKFIGIATNSFGDGCSGSAPTAGSSTSPCYFLHRTAEETGSVDLDANTLVYDLPSGGSSDTAFTDLIVGAIETVATRVPLDVDTAVRDDPTDSEAVDATRFIKRRQPACRATPPADTCWVAPGGVAPEEAVAAVDESTFYLVVPGTRVTFRITFRNDFYEGDTRAQVFLAFIDVRGGGSAVLDTRQVIVVVPANPSGTLM